MSHHIQVPSAEKFDAKKGAQLRTYFQIAAAVGIVGAGATFIWETRLGAHAWLFGFMYAFTVLMGCFFWNCLHHATDAEWTVVIRRQMENLASLLRYIGIFFIPLAIVLLINSDNLYKWLKLDPLVDPFLAGTKGHYLTSVWFWARAVAIFAVLFLLSTVLRKRSIAQDEDGAAKHTFTLRKAAIAGIPAMALCITFGGIDWLKALNHRWFSTMWGVYLFAGAAGASMALIVLVVSWLKRLGYLKVVTDEHYHLMGKFLLAFTIFWAYIGFSQYMLITYANFEEETIYYRLRTTGGWWWLSTFLVFGRFFFMFVPLLFQGLKKSKYINYTAAWILFMQFVDLFVIIMPEYSGAKGFEFKTVIAAVFPWLAIVGVMGLFFLKHLGQSWLFPVKDPRLAESLKCSN